MPKGVFGVSYWSSRRRFKGARDGPSSAALKRLNCPTVTPDATTNLSTSSASLFLCRVIAALSSSSLHPAINCEPLRWMYRPTPLVLVRQLSSPRQCQKSARLLPHSPSIPFPFPPPRPALPRTLHPAEHDPVGKPTTVHTNERPRPLEPSRAHGGLNVLTSGPLESFGVGQKEVVLRSALGSENSK